MTNRPDPTSDALKPCPMCGSDDVQEAAEMNEHWIVCDGCGLSTELKGSRMTAHAAWNRRAAEPGSGVGNDDARDR